MPPFVLSHRERGALEDLVAHLHDARTLRRVQALLWLDEGESPQAVAARLRVSRQTIYNWATRFKGRRGVLDIQARLMDEKRSGRPRTVPPVIDPLIGAVMKRDPREFGYRSPVWTPTLLGQYLRDTHHIAVTRASVSLALRRLKTSSKKPLEFTVAA